MQNNVAAITPKDSFQEFLDQAPELEKDLFDLFTVMEILNEFMNKSDVVESYHIEYMVGKLSEQISKLGEARDIIADINEAAEKKLESV
ncbi:MAG: hypothetical protein ACQEQL_04455 [Pseudomonadota bacterium]